jgi:hypothetical protein
MEDLTLPSFKKWGCRTHTLQKKPGPLLHARASKKIKIKEFIPKKLIN